MGIKTGNPMEATGAPSSNVIPGNPPPNGAIISDVADNVDLGTVGPIPNLDDYGEILDIKVYVDIRQAEDTSNEAGNCIVNVGNVVVFNDDEDPPVPLTAGQFPADGNDFLDTGPALGKTPGGLFLMTEDVKAKVIAGKTLIVRVDGINANFDGLQLTTPQVGLIVRSR